ncbi:MAG: tetratricopeptide repeat protein [Acidobacteriota bacterium]
MSKFFIVFLGLVSGPVTLFGQTQQQQETPPPPLSTPPRIVGQAQSQAELEAWNIVQQAAAREEQIRLCKEFLQNYPESGLTPFAHHLLAKAYGPEDPEKFILHAEEALRELDNLPGITAMLAFFYAERGEDQKAMSRAQQTLDVLGRMEKPIQVTAAQWTKHRYEVSDQAHYALGRALLNQSRGPGREANLAKAVDHLEQALRQSPTDSYACFRLGEAYTRQREYEKAIEAYARTVALGGVIAQYARPHLEEVYKDVHESTDGMEDAVSEQQKIIQEAMAEREQELQKLQVPEPSQPPQ